MLARPRLQRKYGLTEQDSAELLWLLRERAQVVWIRGEVRLCRDPDDDLVIETAVMGRAELLATRDDDLKATTEVATYLGAAGIVVVSVRRFLDLLATNE